MSTFRTSVDDPVEERAELRRMAMAVQPTGFTDEDGICYPGVGPALFTLERDELVALIDAIDAREIRIRDLIAEKAARTAAPADTVLAEARRRTAETVMRLVVTAHADACEKRADEAAAWLDALMTILRGYDPVEDETTLTPLYHAVQMHPGISGTRWSVETMPPPGADTRTIKALVIASDMNEQDARMVAGALNLYAGHGRERP